jgi:hypothetical protein
MHLGLFGRYMTRTLLQMCSLLLLCRLAAPLALHLKLAELRSEQVCCHAW